MSENNDFIQLPPIKKDTPSEVVSMIWQYLKLPEESRKRVKAELINVHENCGKEDFQIPNLYDIVSKEEIAEFEGIMRKIITGIISEASGIATWVYVQKYEKHKTLDEMLQEWKGALNRAASKYFLMFFTLLVFPLIQCKTYSMCE